MKDKSLFDGVPAPDLSPFTGEPVFIASVAEEARRTAAWMEKYAIPAVLLAADCIKGAINGRPELPV